MSSSANTSTLAAGSSAVRMGGNRWYPGGKDAVRPLKLGRGQMTAVVSEELDLRLENERKLHEMREQGKQILLQSKEGQGLAEEGAANLLARFHNLHWKRQHHPECATPSTSQQPSCEVRETAKVLVPVKHNEEDYFSGTRQPKKKTHKIVKKKSELVQLEEMEPVNKNILPAGYQPCSTAPNAWSLRKGTDLFDHYKLNLTIHGPDDTDEVLQRALEESLVTLSQEQNRIVNMFSDSCSEVKKEKAAWDPLPNEIVDSNPTTSTTGAGDGSWLQGIPRSSQVFKRSHFANTVDEGKSRSDSNYGANLPENSCYNSHGRVMPSRQQKSRAMNGTGGCSPTRVNDKRISESKEFRQEAKAQGNGCHSTETRSVHLGSGDGYYNSSKEDTTNGAWESRGDDYLECLGFGKTRNGAQKKSSFKGRQDFKQPYNIQRGPSSPDDEKKKTETRVDTAQNRRLRHITFSDPLVQHRGGSVSNPVEEDSDPWRENDDEKIYPPQVTGESYSWQSRKEPENIRPIIKYPPNVQHSASVTGESSTWNTRKDPENNHSSVKNTPNAFPHQKVKGDSSSCHTQKELEKNTYSSTKDTPNLLPQRSARVTEGFPTWHTRKEPENTHSSMKNTSNVVPQQSAGVMDKSSSCQTRKEVESTCPNVKDTSSVLPQRSGAICHYYKKSKDSPATDRGAMIAHKTQRSANENQAKTEKHSEDARKNLSKPVIETVRRSVNPQVEVEKKPSVVTETSGEFRNRGGGSVESLKHTASVDTSSSTQCKSGVESEEIKRMREQIEMLDHKIRSISCALEETSGSSSKPAQMGQCLAGVDAGMTACRQLGDTDSNKVTAGPESQGPVFSQVPISSQVQACLTQDLASIKMQAQEKTQVGEEASGQIQGPVPAQMDPAGMAAYAAQLHQHRQLVQHQQMLQQQQMTQQQHQQLVQHQQLTQQQLAQHQQLVQQQILLQGTTPPPSGPTAFPHPLTLGWMSPAGSNQVPSGTPSAEWFVQMGSAIQGTTAVQQTSPNFNSGQQVQETHSPTSPTNVPNAGQSTAGPVPPGVVGLPQNIAAQAQWMTQYSAWQQQEHQRMAQMLAQGMMPQQMQVPLQQCLPQQALNAPAAGAGVGWPGRNAASSQFEGDWMISPSDEARLVQGLRHSEENVESSGGSSSDISQSKGQSQPSNGSSAQETFPDPALNPTGSVRALGLPLPSALKPARPPAHLAGLKNPGPQPRAPGSRTRSPPLDLSAFNPSMPPPEAPVRKGVHGGTNTQLDEPRGRGRLR